MYQIDDVIDKKYLIKGLCDDTGGMGTLLMVLLLGGAQGGLRVLKYCKLVDQESVARFKREVRLMRTFEGNGRVMQILDSNLDCDPPYFVMEYFTEGDLTKLATNLRGDLKQQEIVFNQMIDCLSELHSKNVFHRDIKPQNFIKNGEVIVVSDLGLCTELNSPTGFTRSSKWWGTPGFLPPEFLTPGGFKNADAPSDIFMLGKTFYAILSGRDPTYLSPQDVPGPLFAVIERCCVQDKSSRYQSLASVRQSLTAAYDVLLGRAVGSATAINTLQSIMDRLKAANQYDPDVLKKFVEELAMLDENERIQLCLNLPHQIFDLLAQKPLQTHLPQFLDAYEEMADSGIYGFEFAEVIAKAMRVFFKGAEVSPSDKARALRIAIGAAYSQNRYAAMDACTAMITSIADDDLAQRVHDIILEMPYSFISSIEESACKAPAIRKALATLHQKKSE